MLEASEGREGRERGRDKQLPTAVSICLHDCGQHAWKTFHYNNRTR